MIIPLMLGVGVGVLVGRATKRCEPRRGGRSLPQNAATTLLQAERAIEQFRPILEPMSRGRAPAVRDIIRVVR